jgi:hypothetical protein
MAAFDWWLLIVGLIAGAGLVWLVLADSSRRETEIRDEELPIEAAWISASLADEGVAVDQPTAERMLRLHRTYLASLPPDDPSDELAVEPPVEPEPAPPPGTPEPPTDRLREARRARTSRAVTGEAPPGVSGAASAARDR